eukprot:1654728-Amphidinium_carterae.1
MGSNYINSVGSLRLIRIIAEQATHVDQCFNHTQHVGTIGILSGRENMTLLEFAALWGPLRVAYNREEQKHVK